MISLLLARWRLPLLIGLAVALGVSHAWMYWAGWYAGVEHEREHWAKERAQLVADAKANADKLRAQGSRLAAELEVARMNVRVEYVDRVRTIYRTASAAKSCFAPDVTAALNRSSPIIETVERPGQLPQVIAQEGTQQAAGGTSERAAAEWVAHAQAEHSACRQQVKALVAWIEQVTK